MANIWKIIVCGDGGVGKTTLLHRYVDGAYLSDTKITIGAQFHVKNLIYDGKENVLQLWDFGGEKQFRFILPSYCRGAHGAILCYDLTNYSSFQNLNEWLDLIRKSTNNIPVILVGTKNDLSEHEISVDLVDNFMKCLHIPKNFLTSAKNNLNIIEIFEYIVQLMSLPKETMLENIVY